MPFSSILLNDVDGWAIDHYFGHVEIPFGKRDESIYLTLTQHAQKPTPTEVFLLLSGNSNRKLNRFECSNI